jgi:hypothetical protein
MCPRTSEKMSKIFKFFPEKKYREIIKELGVHRYCIYDKGETIPGDVFSKTLGIEEFNCVVAGTGGTDTIYTIRHPLERQVVIPSGEQVIVVRLLRADHKHGKPHYNADDQIIFPTVDGDILRLSRKDAPDHYLEIAKNANMLTIADAFKLPKDKSGDVEKYTERGAKLHVDLLPLKTPLRKAR